MNCLGDYDEQEQSAVQISFDLSMEESFNLKKGGVNDSMNSKRSRKDQMGQELGDSIDKAFKMDGSSFMEDSICVEQNDVPHFAQENTNNPLQSSRKKLIQYSNGSLNQSPRQNPPSTVYINIFDSDLAGTFGSMDSQRSNLKYTGGNTLDPRGPSLSYTNKTYKPMPEEIKEVKEEYVESGFNIMISKEKKVNLETSISDSIKLQGSANFGQAFRTTACFASSSNMNVINSQEKSPNVNSKMTSSLSINPSTPVMPKMPPTPTNRNLNSLSPDQNKVSLKKCASAQVVTPNFVKKMSLRDYMQLNKLSGSRRNRAKQIIQTASTLETNTNKPPSIHGSRRINSPNNIQLKIKEEIANNITKIQNSLLKTMQMLDQVKCGEVNKQDNVMMLYNLNRLLKDKLIKGTDEVNQFLNYHENAFSS